MKFCVSSGSRMKCSFYSYKIRRSLVTIVITYGRNEKMVYVHGRIGLEANMLGLGDCAPN